MDIKILYKKINIKAFLILGVFMLFSINTMEAQGGDCEDCPGGGGGIRPVPDPLTPAPITPEGITPFTPPPIVPPTIDPPPVDPGGGGNNPTPDNSGGDSGFGGYRPPPDPQPDLNPGGGGSYDPSGTGNGSGGGGYDPGNGSGYQDECYYNPCYCYGDCGGNTGGSNTSSNNNRDQDDPEEEKTWYLDKDGDGYYSQITEAKDSPGTDWSTSGSSEDCDDNSFNPFNICTDNPAIYYIDEDDDGFHRGTVELIIGMRSPGPPYKSTTKGKDCDDTNYDLTNTFCLPENNCVKRFGYLHESAFKNKIAHAGINTTVASDNFRDQDGKIIADNNCGSGKIDKGSTVAVIGAKEERDYVKADGTKGKAMYYPVAYDDCPKGNNKNNANFDSNKPCSDCFKGNPLKDMTKILPTPSGKIKGTYDTGMYGNARGRLHDGIDIDIPSGTPLYAMFDGTIGKVVSSQKEGDKWKDKGKWKGDQNAAGNRIYITSSVNGNSVKFGYWHLSTIGNNSSTNLILKTGDKVKQGDLIGYSGTTGSASSSDSSGAHLHLNAKENGKSIDPSKYIKGTINNKTGEISTPCD